MTPPYGIHRGVPAAELAIGALAAALTIFGAHQIIAAVNFDAVSETAGGLGPIWAAVMVAVALVGYRLQAWSPERVSWGLAALAGAAAGLALVPLMAGLYGTAQPPLTVLHGDMSFRTEYITRFASTWQLRDYTFPHLRAFYPPAWFWLAGRTAHWLGLEPWRIVKPFTLGTVGVALALTYALWRRVLTPAGALAAAIGSTLTIIRQTSEPGPFDHATGWYSPYSCFVAVTGAAWVAATLTAVRDGDSRRGWVMLGLVGALLALSYYLLFLILVAVLVVYALATRGARVRASIRTALLLGSVGVLSAVFWVPLLAAVVRGAASQGHYFAPDFLGVQAGFNGPAGAIVLALAAVVALVLGSGWPGARAIAGVLVGTILYQLLSVSSLVLSDNQLQPHRAVTMMWATLGAAVPVAVEGFRRPGSLGSAISAPTVRAVAAVLAVVAVGATFVMGASQGTDLASGPLTVAGHDPVDLVRPQRMSEFITRVTGRAPQDTTLLAGLGEKSVLVTLPYAGFLALRARYAHPDAHLPARIRLLERAANCPDAPCTTRSLIHNRFGTIDAMVLSNVRVGYRLLAQKDGFPIPRSVPLEFPRAHLERRVWARRRFGDVTVFARRAAPLPRHRAGFPGVVAVPRCPPAAGGQHRRHVPNATGGLRAHRAKAGRRGATGRRTRRC